MIHNQFLDALPNLVGGISQSIPTHLAFSSSETDIQFTDNTLSGEAGTRIKLDTPTINNNTITFISIIPSTVPDSDGTYLTATGLFTSATNGDLWATSLVASVLHTTTFEIEVRHQIRFNRS